MNITLRQYFELVELHTRSFDSELDRMVEYVSIAYDEDPEIIFDLPFDELVSRSKKIDDLFKRSFPKSADKVKVNELILHRKPFDLLTLGEWIDIESYISRKDNIIYLSTILYRQLTTSDFYEDRWELYGNWVEKRIPFFMEVPISLVYSIRNEYIDWRDNLMLVYSGLFDTLNEEFDDSTLTPELRAEIKKAEDEDAKERVFIWERLIMDLCNGDITKFDDVTNQPLITVLNVLSMKKTTKK